MFEYRWLLPDSEDAQTVRLQVRARNGWSGRKLLFVGNRRLYARTWLGGINHTFTHPSAPDKTIELRAVQDTVTGLWYPQLTCDGQLVTELSNTPPPPVPNRPKSVAIVTGVTYLLMLMMLVMSTHIATMLEASLGHSDNRAFVIAVESAQPRDRLRPQQTELPPARIGEPFDTHLAAAGGVPPYQWTRLEGQIPAGLSFDAATGRIHGTPERAGDHIIRLRLHDAQGETADWAYVISIRQVYPESLPQITDVSFTRAQEGVEFTAQLTVTGGQPPYRWVLNDRKLPKGIKKQSPDADTDPNGATLILKGTPGANVSGKIKKIDPEHRRIRINGDWIPIDDGATMIVDGKPVAFDDLQVAQMVALSDQRSAAYPVLFRVYDSSYSAYRDIAAWFVPFGATSICLLGFWNMRRWGVILYGILILGQIVAPRIAEGYPLPTSAVAILLQILVFLVGAASFGKMR